jgi:cell division initiation protein
MELTPNEIRNQTFTSSFRGYHKEEVEAFKEAAAAALEEAKVEILKLTEEREMLKQHYNDLKSLEDTIRAAVIEAQRSAETILSNAKREAELVVAEAVRVRDEALEQRRRRLAELDAKIEEFQFARRSFYAKLRADIESHMRLLDSMNPELPENRPREYKNPPETGEDIDKIVDQFRRDTGNTEGNPNG